MGFRENNLSRDLKLPRPQNLNRPSKSTQKNNTYSTGLVNARIGILQHSFAMHRVAFCSRRMSNKLINGVNLRLTSINRVRWWWGINQFWCDFVIYKCPGRRSDRRMCRPVVLRQIWIAASRQSDVYRFTIIVYVQRLDVNAWRFFIGRWMDRPWGAHQLLYWLLAGFTRKMQPFEILLSCMHDTWMTFYSSYI